MPEPENACDAGVYLIYPAQCDEIVRQGSLPRGTPLFVLAGDDLSGREPLFAAMARMLSFPDYFGHNWDAVYDCLTDPSVLPAAGVVLVLNGFDAIATREPEQWNIALKVLCDACVFWRPLSRELFVLLVGDPELAPGIPPLSNRCLDA